MHLVWIGDKVIFFDMTFFICDEKDVIKKFLISFSNTVFTLASNHTANKLHANVTKIILSCNFILIKIFTIAFSSLVGMFKVKPVQKLDFPSVFMSQGTQIAEI